MFTGKQFAELAMDNKYNRYTYDQLDCQAFVEKVLADLGVRKPDGSVYNWRGSNSMYRNYFQWRGSKEECIKVFGCIPSGAFVYVWEESGEEERGYHDGLGNAKHVGIYCGGELVRDSTRYKGKGGQYVRDGVGDASINSFNMVTLPSMLDFSEKSDYDTDVTEMFKSIEAIRNELDRLEGFINDISGN